MKRFLIAGLLFAALIYGADYLRLQYLDRGHAAVGNVTLETYYAVKLKNGKVEYDYAGPQNVECVRSLLPHWGDKPCWLIGRKKEQQIDIDSGNPNNPKLF